MQTTEQPLREEEIAEVGADEAGPARDQHAHARAPQAGTTGFRPIE